MTSLRFSQAAFRRYEPCIAKVVSEWPNPVEFNPADAGFSLETFTCRLRDAFKAAVRYNYSTDMFNLTRLYEIYPDLAVAQRGARVLVGPRSALRKIDSIHPMHISVPSKDRVYIVVKPSQEVLSAFCLLLSHRLLDRPVLAQSLDTALLLYVQQNYDIDATTQPDGSVLIV